MVEVTSHSRALGRGMIAGLKRCATQKMGSRLAGSFRRFYLLHKGGGGASGAKAPDLLGL